MDEVGLAYSAVADQYIDLFGNTEHMHTDDLALIKQYLSIRPVEVRWARRVRAAPEWAGVPAT